MENRFDLKLSNFMRSFIGLEEKSNKWRGNNDRQKALLYDFGGCSEQSWKILKYYLEFIEGYDNFGNASKKVYRAARDSGIIDENQLTMFMECVDLRNLLFHEYDYSSIEKYCEKIENYIDAFRKLSETLQDLKMQWENEFEKDSIDL